MMTAYDYTSAKLVERSGINVILVGDSLNMVMLGRKGTASLMMDEAIHHCRAVANGAKRPFLIGDMPFMSYQINHSEAIRNAGRFIQEGGMDAIKLEGGAEMADTVRAIVRAGVPVMGHIGLTPQTISQIGGFRIQGKTAKSAYRILQDAKALQEAGCFALILESVPSQLAQAISQALTIPCIGIGAGVGCDGQVLVFHDMLAMFDDLQPKFVKQYAQVGQLITEALEEYQEDVKNRAFPAAEHSYQMSDKAWDTFQEMITADNESL